MPKVQFPSVVDRLPGNGASNADPSGEHVDTAGDKPSTRTSGRAFAEAGRHAAVSRALAIQSVFIMMITYPLGLRSLNDHDTISAIPAMTASAGGHHTTAPAATRSIATVSANRTSTARGGASPASTAAGTVCMADVNVGGICAVGSRGRRCRTVRTAQGHCWNRRRACAALRRGRVSATRTAPSPAIKTCAVKYLV